jgi:hypothetical protein
VDRREADEDTPRRRAVNVNQARGQRYSHALRRSTVVRCALARVLGALPFRRSTTLVVDAEVAAREPPSDGAAECCALAPAVRVATAHSIAGVVDALEQASCHTESVASRIVRRAVDRLC